MKRIFYLTLSAMLSGITFSGCSTGAQQDAPKASNSEVTTDTTATEGAKTESKAEETRVESTLKYMVVSESTVKVKQDESYKALESITIPAETEIDGKTYKVVGFDDFAFNGCVKLTSVIIPSTIENIDHGAFESCSNLKSIIIPEGVKTIGFESFSNCNGLAEVTIPSSVTTIEDAAFFNCKSLKNVTIPSNVHDIGTNAFTQCENLDLVIENAEKDMFLGEDAFFHCKSVKFTK